jgi:hypothetical protein
MWAKSFVAARVLLGASAEEAAAELAEDARASAQALLEGLAEPSRVARAKALARAAQDIAVALDEVTLR